MAAELYECEPRHVWIWRSNAPSGGLALPARPGLLVAWRRTEPDPPTPARWQALVVSSVHGLLDVRWRYDTELMPTVEPPPVR